MMMKKISYLAIAVSLATLAGCGGGGSSDSGMTSGSNNSNTGNNNSSGNTTNQGSCNRGVLLNSNLTAKSIFDDSLYSIDYLNIMQRDSSGFMETKKNGIYAEKISLSGQMLYSEYLPIYNLSLTEIETNEQSKPVDYNLNSSGLYTTKTYQKQNNGWPLGYLTTSSNLKLSLASFNDKCNFSVNKLDYTFESIDLSGKKIKDILPNNILTSYPKAVEYTYINDQVGNILKREDKALNNLMNSTDTFPQGSIIYLPKSAIYDDNQFSFSEDNATKFQTLDEWFNALYGKSSYKYKHDTVGGLNVIYSIDSNGNPVYGAADPAIEMNGKIYDGEWSIKGDVLSPTYGLQNSNTPDYINYETPSEHALFNKTAYEFISAKIQTYYK
ncbi:MULTISPECIES: hypothetical protein [Acinetobacter]|nr:MULTISPECIES: hypothetical protein [Acinetobacter]